MAMKMTIRVTLTEPITLADLRGLVNETMSLPPETVAVVTGSEDVEASIIVEGLEDE